MINKAQWADEGPSKDIETSIVKDNTTQTTSNKDKK